MDLALQIYNWLPHKLQSVAATLRGVYLRSWRYGADTERLVTEAIEREQWSLQQWKSWQEERLAFVLHRAATRVPYYREQWTVRRRHGDDSPFERLENWPLLEKERLRENPLAFLADDCDTRRMFHEHTSGTTGKPLDLWWSRETVRRWYALFEARWRRWYGVSRRNRWATVGGQLVASADRNHPPFWVWNAAMNQLYMSSYHISTQFTPSYLNALRHYRIEYLWGYSSSLYALAEAALRLNMRDIRFAVVITNAEPLTDVQRDTIAEAFQCPVRETYGMAEIVTAAGECQAGWLHLWPEVGVVEVEEEGRPLSDGMAGDLVCTGLFNTDMPLIRYCVGDRGAMAGVEEDCQCGRALPRLAFVEGRVDDTLYTRDGRRIGRLDPIFKTRLPVHEVQIIQDSLDHIRIRYVPSPEFTAAASDSIADRLRSRLGDIDLVFEEMEKIPRDANGKFRAVVCKLSQQEREEALAK